MNKIKNIICSLIIVLILVMSYSVNALTIKETTEEDAYDTIEPNTFVIGITKFSPGTTITAAKVTRASYNDVIFNYGKDNYFGVNVYYHAGNGVWFEINEENEVSRINETDPAYSELNNLDIYYVDNVEKIISIPYAREASGGTELVFRTNNNKEVTYEDGNLIVPATVEVIEVYEKNTQTDDEVLVEKLAKNETGESFEVSVTTPRLVHDNYVLDNYYQNHRLMLLNVEDYCAIDECDGSANDVYTIDGYEVYEKNGDEYNHVASVAGLGTYNISIEPNQTITYAARAFVQQDGDTYYSDYSEDVTVSVPIPTPTIAFTENPDAQLDQEPGYDYKWIEISNLDDYIYIDNGETVIYKADGFTLYNIVGEEYTSLGTYAPGELISVSTLTGTSKNLSVRAYVNDSNNEKVYSPDSNVLVFESAPDPTIDFKSAVKMDVSGATEGDNPGIVANADKYSVTKNGNTITVTDEGLEAYVGGDINEPKKWVGILVDLGVEVQGTNYYILPEDYNDAARWGAENDTTFILWLTTEQGGTYTFKNVNDEEDTIAITVEFTEPAPTIDFKSAVKMDVSGATEGDNPGIVANANKYSVTKNGNTITVTDEGLEAYVGGDINEPKKWVGILVDLGVEVQGTNYYILPEDYNDAARWGAENDTTFILWLTTEQGGTYTFKNVNDEEDTISITVEFSESI